MAGPANNSALHPLGWRETVLLSRPKSDPAKLAIATRLRRETTLPIKTIAAAPSPGHLQECQYPLARRHEPNGADAIHPVPPRPMKPLKNEPCYGVTLFVDRAGEW